MYNNRFVYYHPYQNYSIHNLYNGNVNYHYHRFYPYSYEYYRHFPSDWSFRQQIDLGKVWIYEEEGGSRRGEFRRRGNSNIFDAKWWTVPEMEEFSTVITMRLEGDTVYFRYPSNLVGIAGETLYVEYHGKIFGDTVTGSYGGPPGISTRWSAKILR